MGGFTWRSLCRLCGKTPNECFVDKFPDLRVNADLFHLAQQFLYGSAIWERNAVIPTCFECEKFLIEIFHFSQSCIKTRDMLVDLRNKQVMTEEDATRHRNAYIRRSNMTFVLPLEDEPPETEVIKAEGYHEEEVEIIMMANNDDWAGDQKNVCAAEVAVETEPHMELGEVQENEEEEEEDEQEEEVEEQPQQEVEIKIIKRSMPSKPKYKTRKRYKCEVCQKGFVSEKARVRHIKVHDRIPMKLDCEPGEKPFQCEECGKGLSTRSNLKEHMIVHTEARPLHCSKCPKTFKNLQRLRIHEDIHNDTLYICTLCGLQLNTRRTLTMHMVVHSDAKNFKCEHCGNEYKRAKALKNHLITHTGLRPYMCPFCDKTFANGSNCRTHKRKTHPELLAELEATRNKEDLKVKTLPSINELKNNIQLMAEAESSAVTILPFKPE